MFYKDSRIKLITKTILFLLLFGFSSSSFSAVWRATNTWDNVWEKRYQHWVKNNWTEEFFMDPKKPIYYKYAHDCADAVYAMRLMMCILIK